MKSTGKRVACPLHGHDFTQLAIKEPKSSIKYILRKQLCTYVPSIYKEEGAGTSGCFRRVLQGALFQEGAVTSRCRVGFAY